MLLSSHEDHRLKSLEENVMKHLALEVDQLLQKLECLLRHNTLNHRVTELHYRLVSKPGKRRIKTCSNVCQHLHFWLAVWFVTREKRPPKYFGGLLKF
jgi:hypothetical protein